MPRESELEVLSQVLAKGGLHGMTCRHRILNGESHGLEQSNSAIVAACGPRSEQDLTELRVYVARIDYAVTQRRNQIAGFLPPPRTAVDSDDRTRARLHGKLARIPR